MQVCGEACRTAVETIANAGLDAWYGLRTHSDAQGAATDDPRHRAELDTWRVPEVEASLLRRSGNSGDDDDHRTSTALGHAPASTAVTLSVEGMRCAGCAWLVERLLASVPGVTTATVDFPLRRAEVRFDTPTTRLHTLLETLAKAGYRATPYSVHAEEAARLAASGERVLMLGDGVNDTPALAGAHVSVAMGRGAAAAAARADAVLIGDDPGRLLIALDIARRARRIVKQNLAWALGYNLVALPLAASGAVPPWAAAIGMSLSSLAVAANALRLGRGRPHESEH